MSKKSNLQDKYEQACELAELLQKEAFDVLKTLEKLDCEETVDGKNSTKRTVSQPGSEDGNSSGTAKGN